MDRKVRRVKHPELHLHARRLRLPPMEVPALASIVERFRHNDPKWWDLQVASIALFSRYPRSNGATRSSGLFAQARLVIRISTHQKRPPRLGDSQRRNKRLSADGAGGIE